MKNLKKMVAIALVSLSMVAVGALAEDMVVVELASAGQPVATMEETATHWVRFYDANGVEIAAVEVKEGESIPALETIAGLEEMAGGSWYSMADETKAAYALDAAVMGDIALTLNEVTEETDYVDALAQQILGETVIVEEEATEEIAMQILGSAAVVEEALTEEIPAAEQILGGAIVTEETEMETNEIAQQILGGIMETEVEVEAEAPVIEEGAEEVEEELFEIEDEAAPLAGPAPSIEVVCDYEGELKAGTEVTVRAVVHNLPEMYQVNFQWQNDAMGAYADVNGATEQSFTFVVDEYHAEGCNWRVNATISA